MKKFRFRLEPVIQYRRYLERIAQLELAREKQAFVKTQERISTIKKTMRHTAKALAMEKEQGIDVQRCDLFLTYLRGLDHDIETENKCLVDISDRIREKQEVARGETVKKKTLEWVKENEYSKYLEWVNRIEQNMTDELISQGKHESYD